MPNHLKRKSEAWNRSYALQLDELMLLARRGAAVMSARRALPNERCGAARRGTMQQHALFGAAWRDAMQPSIHLGAARCGMEQASASSGAAQRDAARHMPVNMTT